MEPISMVIERFRVIGDSWLGSVLLIVSCVASVIGIGYLIIDHIKQGGTDGQSNCSDRDD